MKFEHAAFALSGRTVRIADPSCPVEHTLCWVYLSIHQAYVDDWFASRQGRYNRSNFDNLNKHLLEALLGSRSADVARVQSALGKGPALLELAQDIESGRVRTVIDPSATKRGQIWFSRRSLGYNIEVPGYQRAMAAFEDFILMLNREAMSTSRSTEMVSLLKRLDPLLPALTQYGTPGSGYAVALLELLKTWNPVQDRCLALVP